MSKRVTGSKRGFIGNSFGCIVFLFFVSGLTLTGCSGPISSSSSISVSLTAFASTLIPKGTVTINAKLSGLASGQSPNVNWNLSPEVGTFICTSVFVHSAECSQIIYTAPVAVTSPISLTITASSSADPTKSASVNITINLTASFLYGRFLFSFSGFDANGPVSTAGTFSVDQNGNITSGEEDFKDTTTQTPFPQPISGSCQNFAVTEMGFCRLTTGSETFQYDFALRSDFEFARFIEDPSDGLGIIHHETGTGHSPVRRDGSNFQRED